jgi:uracil-DNA glycosylase
MADDRGAIWEHDPGPPAGSGWAELFAATPNYRGLGVAVVHREAFRWHFGPMFFRGRLDGSARVLVIGQEGAQDESLAHRSFTGSTGGRLQSFLRQLGLDRSYLFLNTFVYPIFGQYTMDLRPLAQDPRSPIAAHRHQLFDHAVATSDLRLVIAVGRAAKESVATWVAHHGGKADPEQLHKAKTGDLGTNLKLIGVLHPGGAGSGGSLDAIKESFQAAMNQVRTWLTATPSWLPTDPGMTRDLHVPYQYAAAGVPFRDFPFGICPRLGRGATTSNRTDDQRGIRLFGATGRYNASGANLRDGASHDGSNEGYASDTGDVPYEPPRKRPTQFDRGPPADLARLLLGQEPGFAWPDFAGLGVTSDPTFGVGPLYRGRFRRLSLLVLADQASHDDVFTGRALCGEAGQRLQRLLGAAGISTRYLVLRTLPVDTLGLSTATVNACVAHPAVRALHQELIQRVRAANSGLAAVLALGRGAGALAPNVVPSGLPILSLRAWGTSGWKTSWQAALDRLATMTYTKDLSSPSFQADGGRGQIPRADLPYGTPRWIGTSGDRGDRPIDLDTSRASPSYLKILLPAWVNALTPRPLSAAEQAAADALD